MRLGVCTGPEHLEAAAAMGYDYIEWAINAIAALPEEEYQAWLQKSKGFPIPILKGNCFLSGDVKVTGPEANEAVQRAYLDKAMGRSHALGIRTIVFGSGASRRVPEGFAHTEAWRQIAAFLHLVEEYCVKYEIEIAIEPLRRKETNIINLVSEGTALAGLLQEPHIGVLGDSFHMICSAEPWQALTYAGKALKHIHISHELPDLSSRVYPYAGDGSDYEGLLNTLKAMGYEGDVSIEAGTQDWEAEAKAAFACLRPLMT